MSKAVLLESALELRMRRQGSSPLAPGFLYLDTLSRNKRISFTQSEKGRFT